MRNWTKFTILAALLIVPQLALATSCTTQALMSPQERNALATAGERLAIAVANQDYATVQATLLPSVAGDWERIRSVVEASAPLVKGGQMQLRSAYLLDTGSRADSKNHTSQGSSAPTDTQFFCSNASGSLTVTILLHSLAEGRYAVVLADASGAPLGGQLGLILAWDGQGAMAGWKLGGVAARQGIFDNHDGVWYWGRARELAKKDTWSAWYSYEAARWLLTPVDYLSSPNLDKLNQEQSLIANAPPAAFPYTLTDGPRIWKIDSVNLDPSLNLADLGVTYESTGVTDSAAVRTEATAVLSRLLKAQPGLRENFHGLWAYAVKDGKRTPVIELPMSQIP